EVKSRVINHGVAKNSLNSICSKLNQLRNFPSFNNIPENRKLFVGILSYDYNDADFDSEQIAAALNISAGFVNHISLGENKFIRFWNTTEGLVPPLATPGPCYIRYDLAHLSFSYFISNLLHIVSDDDPEDRYWFSFPIEGT